MANFDVFAIVDCERPSQWHESQVREFVETRLHAFEAQDQPRLVTTCGFVGSGKSTICATLRRSDTIYIAFDAIMESLPEYVTEKASNGAQAAFEKFEWLARSIGYALLQHAVERRVHVLFDHSNARADHVELLRRIAARAYAVELHECTSCDVAVALARAKQRDRFSPEAYVIERRRVALELLPAFEALADTTFHYDTNGAAPVRLHDPR